MQVEFKDRTLALIESDRAGEIKLPIAAINSCRDKLVVIRAAPDERTLRNWRSLHYEKLKGKRKSQMSIRLNQQYRMVFTIDAAINPPKMTILAIEDYH